MGGSKVVILIEWACTCGYALWVVVKARTGLPDCFVRCSLPPDLSETSNCTITACALHELIIAEQGQDVAVVATEDTTAGL